MKKLPKIILLFTLTLLFLPFLASAVIPPTPENLQPGWLFGDIILTWDPVPAATGYNVYRYNEGSSSWTTAATGLTVPYYREANVLDPTHYTVSAVNAEGESTAATSVLTQQTGEWFYMMFTSGYGSFYDTKAIISWSVSPEAGADGILEVGTSSTNLLYIGRDTNYTTSHRFTVTNLLPETAYIGRITSVTSNRTGVTGWIQFNTLATNRPPVVSLSTTISMFEDDFYPARFYVSAWDPDWNNVTITVSSGPAHGTLTRGNDGYYSYVPDTNWFGTETITFVASDGQLTSEPGTVTIEVLSFNDPPVATPVVAVTGEDMPLEIPLQAFDVEGDTVSFWVSTFARHGWAQASGMKAIYYPAPNFLGADTFWVVPSDAQNDGQAVLVTVTVTNVNDAPLGTNFPISAHAGSSYFGFFLVSDEEGDPITCEIATWPTNGTVTVNGTNFVYTPNPGMYFQDSFTYRGSDGRATGAEATVWVNVTGTNHIPQAQDAHIIVIQNREASFGLTVQDPDSDQLQAVLLAPPTNGTVEIVFGMGVRYHPQTNFVGLDGFTYVMTDGSGTSAVATVTLEVIPNRPPVADPQSFTLPEDWSTGFSLTGSDPDGDPISIVLLTSPAHGKLYYTNPNYLYTPDPNFNGTDRFDFTVNDGATNGNIVTVNITVTPVNDPPVRVSPDRSFTLAEDTSMDFDMQASDVDGDTLTYTIVTPPAHGTAIRRSANTWTYQPATNWFGTDRLTWVANDGQTNCALGTVQFQVSAVNDRPIAANSFRTNAEDTPFAITLSGVDVEGSPLTCSIVTPPSHGTLNGTGFNRVYTPAANYVGQDSFVFKVNDGSLDSLPATVTITVTNVNDAPVTSSQAVTTAEDTAVAITLTGSDADGDVLTAQVVSGPVHGTVTLNGLNLVYTPNPNFTGNDSITFHLNDGTTNSATATVSVTVTPVNDAPMANAQALTTTEDTSVTITLTGSDADGDSLSFSLVSNPAHGTLSGTPPNLIYTPAANFNGGDGFTFSVNDGKTGSATATVSITVTPLNDAPVANAQSITTAEDSPATVTLAGSDADGDTLVFNVVSTPAHGSLSGTPPNLVYTPVANFNGSDSFTFSVNDGTTGGNTATVSITVTPVNDAPAAQGQSVSTQEDTAFSITMLGSDPDGDALTYSIVRGPTNGYLNVTGGPTRLYTPNGNFHGSDSFEFKVTDTAGAASTGLVSITVTSVNDTPVSLFNGMTISAVEDTARQVLLSADDYDGDALTYIIVNPPAHGTISGPGPLVTYTPAPNYNGTDSFSWKASDGTAESAVAAINVNVAAVNDVPVANGQSLTTSEDTPLSLTLTGSDVDGDALSFVIVSVPAKGTLSGTAPNLVYMPNPNATGSDSFTFKVNDGTVNGTVATVALTITAVNDAPVANAQTVSTAYNTALNITLVGTDVEGSPLTFTIVSTPANGTLTGTGATKTFSPSIGWSGTTTFSFKVNDGTLDSSAATVTINVAPPSSTPAIPSGLTATVASSTQINLAWSDTSTNEDGFKIERSTDNRTFTQIATVGPSVQSFSSTGLASNKTYYYRVRAFNSLGNSGYSGTVSTKTLK